MEGKKHLCLLKMRYQVMNSFYKYIYINGECIKLFKYRY